ncbi:thioesterase|nr:thioesterase [Candidatus Pantoea persica]
MALYHPFYMEWTRHAFMREALGIYIEEEFKQGRLYMVLEYSLRFRKSLQKGDRLEVTYALEKNEKRNRVNFVQQIKVDGVTYAEATFVATSEQRSAGDAGSGHERTESAVTDSVKGAARRF